MAPSATSSTFHDNSTSYPGTRGLSSITNATWIIVSINLFASLILSMSRMLQPVHLPCYGVVSWPVHWLSNWSERQEKQFWKIKIKMKIQKATTLEGGRNLLRGGTCQSTPNSPFWIVDLGCSVGPNASDQLSFPLICPAPSVSAILANLYTVGVFSSIFQCRSKSHSIHFPEGSNGL